MMRRLKILWISIEYILIFMDAILIWITIDEILISLIMRNDGFPYFCINQVIRRWLLLSDVISVFDTAWLGVLMLVIYRRVWRMQCNFYACFYIYFYTPVLLDFEFTFTGADGWTSYSGNDLAIYCQFYNLTTNNILGSTFKSMKSLTK